MVGDRVVFLAREGRPAPSGSQFEPPPWCVRTVALCENERAVPFLGLFVGGSGCAMLASSDPPSAEEPATMRPTFEVP